MNNLDSEESSDMKERLIDRTAKRLADNLLIDMQQIFKSIDLPEDDMLFQAQVCHLLSAFMLSHTIKILKIKKVPQVIINQIGDSCVDMAIDFATKGNFRKVEEH